MKKKREPVVLEQWVELEMEDGQAVAKLYPSNARLIEEGKAMEQAPDLVYRRLNFPQGIPQEYRWASVSHPERFERGGMGTQRMTVDTWLEVIEREAASGTGHVGPTGVGNLPRATCHRAQRAPTALCACERTRRMRVRGMRAESGGVGERRGSEPSTEGPPTSIQPVGSVAA